MIQHIIKIYFRIFLNAWLFKNETWLHRFIFTAILDDQPSEEMLWKRCRRVLDFTHSSFFFSLCFSAENSSKAISPSMLLEIANFHSFCGCVFWIQQYSIVCKYIYILDSDIDIYYIYIIIMCTFSHSTLLTFNPLWTAVCQALPAPWDSHLHISWQVGYLPSRLHLSGSLYNI